MYTEEAFKDETCTLAILENGGHGGAGIATALYIYTTISLEIRHLSGPGPGAGKSDPKAYPGLIAAMRV